MVKVLVGIPTYNGAHRVDWLLQSISMRTGKNIDYKIVICDDSGNKEHQEKTRPVADKWSSELPVSLLINDKNMGVAKSWNRIIKSEDSQHIILINDDIIVAKDWLENMVYFLENNQNAGAVIYDCLFVDNDDIPELLSSINPIVKPRDLFSREQIDNFDYDEDTYPVRCMVSWGCFFGLRRDIYDVFGEFDENYFAYFEEFDFFTNLARHGFPNYLLRHPRNWHIWSATLKGDPNLNIGSIFEKSRQYYNKKWNGDHTVCNSIYMSKIPFQNVKWLCNGNTYEKILIDNYGYFQIEIDTNRRIELHRRMKVLIGIPTYNGAHRVDWLLQSISMRTGKNIDYKIVICDDSGNKEHQEKTRSVVDKWSSELPVSLLINDKNMGVAKSWNRIIKSEDSQHIILINDDIIVAKDWLENMVYFLENNQNAGAVCYDFVMTDERDTQFFLNLEIKDCYDNMSIRPIRQMDALGCLFGFRREMYDMVEGFDNNYVTNFDETDFFTSLASHGYPIYILQCPKILHVYSATFKTSPELDYWKRFNTSKQYYIKKWNGDKTEVSKRYMCEIPFQKVMWLCDNNTHEEILIDDYGYFQVEMKAENDEMKLKM